MVGRSAAAVSISIFVVSMILGIVIMNIQTALATYYNFHCCGQPDCHHDYRDPRDYNIHNPSMP